MWDRSTDQSHDRGSVLGADIEMFVISVDIAETTSTEAAGVVASAPHSSGVSGLSSASSARQGTGAWPNGERAVRLGHAEEILITLATNPFTSMGVARSGEVFDTPIPALRVDMASRRDGDFEVSWAASLRAPLRWRKVSLRIYASPSLNVTVMTIVPDKARKISSRWFVHRGLRAARHLGARIETAA